MTDEFATLSDFRALLAGFPHADTDMLAAAQAHNMQLTKPPGALGQLEDLALWYRSWRGGENAEISAPQVIVFAGNHGVAARGVSAFPAEVTAQMVMNFQHGGAAINQIARVNGATLDVVALNLENPTQDFTQGPAMSEDECVAALQAGWNTVNPDADLLVVGEMGIANTTSAAALACALLGGDAAEWTGRGTGVDDAGLTLKTQVVAEGVALHKGQGDGLETLRRLGGRELAAMAGAMVRARSLRIPVILDGFICSAAALCLAHTHEGALDHAVAGHQSAEGGHERLLAALGKVPLLQLGLRLGEASGAALAISVLKGAMACHASMATFAQAGVSDS
ncbi:nicotinate-nucleotide--dimethylbenzimidazole phosphoribosyltransferase [Sulfitobacter sp. M57]|uniref:nicotinate-nucleotide--dimethylbenzimidazole phosphoribosyltransferase n=1 Tax=unclassified Sulfitobacter TaxID=196795 RepID=UPI0023E09188|nr:MULTISPECIES: nicotinate-nucleotide--dimethylbenzimidazole phosphoribosyltransferase [unclassified Sulfitobacter]MDF3413185.1 nicotinate-nucleotide--dimethylbenzimidazole phosphoribosyltransferase [Sulfitobacter sp. KE5]MDF3421532.1 nicotinate-nucleotide--dimethylbenzimidazole phosphoribosyltransferase [Sulfitobacter sp. KE43]MDF3431734.1 nicotinate-nucleotide--dimethylbenzimidazole phosphoribosyltransferase [Sulfitobacter sp. KE42]MDF3457375.1 nicotinate-nucleotide--dimethylbenzimidazole ph